MTRYQVVLTPTFRNPGTEGSMDTSLNALGFSVQRTMNFLNIPNSTNLKIGGQVADGGLFNNSITATINDLDYGGNADVK